MGLSTSCLALVRSKDSFCYCSPLVYVIRPLLRDRVKARELLTPALSSLPVAGAAHCPHLLHVINSAFPCCLLQREDSLFSICKIRSRFTPCGTSLGGLYLIRLCLTQILALGEFCYIQLLSVGSSCGARKYPSCRPAGHFCSGTESRQLTAFPADRGARMGEAKIH